MSEQSTATENEDLRELVRRLATRLETVEEELAELKRAASAEIPQEDLLAIAAAVSAYLGNRAKVKTVRFAREAGWTQQGRETLQRRSVPHIR